MFWGYHDTIEIYLLRKCYFRSLVASNGPVQVDHSATVNNLYHPVQVDHSATVNNLYHSVRHAHDLRMTSDDIHEYGRGILIIRYISQ